MNDDCYLMTLDTPITANELIDAVGNVLGVSGTQSVKIGQIAALKDAVEGCLTFCRDEGKMAEASLRAAVNCVVVVKYQFPASPGQCLIRVEDPRGWFINALNHLFGHDQSVGIHPSAVIGNNVKIGTNVFIGPNCVISDSSDIGDNTRLESGIFLGPGSVVGRDCVIGSNSSIGVVGLGYHKYDDGHRVLFPHLGRAIIGGGVCIGSNCCIVRGMIEHTLIGDNAKIGNIVNIGHNCKVGSDVTISTMTVLTGGAIIENGATLAAGVSVNSHVTIGSGAVVGMGSAVTKHVAVGTSVFGVPAKPLRTMRPL